jgi:23S rRNA (uridine2552-2'-O)-methyltransferase
MREGHKSKSGTSRLLTVRVKTAAKRSVSSTRWLSRQLNDPYVIEAQKRGYRSRAAFKLIQLDEKFHIFKPGDKIVDLGAAPGGWTQVALSKVVHKGKNGLVIGIDILDWETIPGATCFVGDFLEDDSQERILKALQGQKANVVLSDMAAPTTGHPGTDHLRIIYLCDIALDFAMTILAPGGIFVAKVFKGGSAQQFLSLLKTHFKSVKHAKPPASRSESAESYVVATDFRGYNP